MPINGGVECGIYRAVEWLYICIFHYHEAQHLKIDFSCLNLKPVSNHTEIFNVVLA